MKRKILIAFALFLAVAFSSNAQKFALKTNLLYDATATVNVGAEIGLAPRWTFDLSGNLNSWTINDHKWKHFLIQPEARYWFCDRFQGHFLGAHLLGGIYNIGYIKNNFKFLGKDYSPLTDHRFQGWFAGAGVAYGYAIPLSKHWNLEFEIGAGYVYTVYDEFECWGCGKTVQTGVPQHYVGPTKAAINLVYVF